jgi:hypothetical protein
MKTKHMSHEVRERVFGIGLGRDIAVEYPRFSAAVKKSSEQQVPMLGPLGSQTHHAMTPNKP